MYNLRGVGQWAKFLRHHKLNVKEKQLFAKYIRERGYSTTYHTEVLEWLFCEWMQGKKAGDV